MSTTLTRTLPASILMLSLVVLSFPAVSLAKEKEHGDKIEICHNGYVITVDEDSFENGHDGDFKIENDADRTRCEAPVVVPPTPPVTENPAKITIIAAKVVCSNESDLPNWGLKNGTDGHPAGITATTASDWVATHPGCHLEDGWSFQWGTSAVSDPGRDFIGEAAGFTTFGPTVSGIVSTDILMSAISTGAEVRLREVLKDAYIAFTYDATHTEDNNVSAEFYCGSDMYHYDNFDFIGGPVAGNTYYCVAFNAAKTSTPTDETTDVCPNIDGVQATVPSGKVIVAGSCVDAGGGGPAQTFTYSSSGGSGGGSGGGTVLGASTEAPKCAPILKGYIKHGWKNDAEEVKRLQKFLGEQLHIDLPVTGFFGPATLAAVKQFQKTEWDKVLKPWFNIPGSGIKNENTPTGYVYQTTKWHINNIVCPGSENFPEKLD